VRVRHVDGVDHVLAVRRNLAHEAEALLRVLLGERAPVNQIVVADGADFLGWESARRVPLSLAGPSTSMPMVLPSREKEWQLPQVGRPVITTLLWAR
jgi:hypothetical protein